MRRRVGEKRDGGKKKRQSEERVCMMGMVRDNKRATSLVTVF